MAGYETLMATLAEWMGLQRWFTGTSDRPSLRYRAVIELGRDDDVQVAIHFIEDRSTSHPVLYQVPLVLRRARGEESGRGFVGEFETTDGETLFAFDGPEDEAFTTALLRLIVEGTTCGDERAGAHGVPAPGSSFGTPSEDALSGDTLSTDTLSTGAALSRMRSRVLSGEQSNTSIIYSGDAKNDEGNSSSGVSSIICKVFRMLHDGENPDVVLQSAMFAAGSAAVPPLVGSVVAHWPDPSLPEGLAHGHLAFAQQFLAGCGDGWSVAVAAAVNGTDFAEESRLIGAATAEMHAILASTLPRTSATREDKAETVASWNERLDAAIAEVPELASLRPSIQAIYARAESVVWPGLQRVHGDLHLGQLLARPDGSWVIIDFEGEPLRPLADRSRPDLPLRDVAGMLRSFDYATGGASQASVVSGWAASCRDSFLHGYRERSGVDVGESPELLDALELDKALYEVVYEARNRPGWLAMPLAAVYRLASAASGVGE